MSCVVLEVVFLWKLHENWYLMSSYVGGSCIPSSSVEGVLAELEIEKVGRLRKAYDKVRWAESLSS